MGFVEKFFTADESNRPSAPAADSRPSSFEHLTEAELEAHLQIDRYGGFQLTGAVRPSYDLRVTPQQGYRFDTYHDEEAKAKVPVLMAAASRELLFDLYLELVSPLGKEVDVVLETSHRSSTGGHEDLYRANIDLPVLKSILWDFEDLLLHDGCTGVAVLNPNTPQEVQFDEHKLLIVYGEPLYAFVEILERHGVERDDELKFITEAEHVHSSSDRLFEQFGELKTRLGMDGSEAEGADDDECAC